MTSTVTRTRSVRSLWRTTIGKKAVMAVTGLIMVLFLILHMLGNLKIFFGSHDFDGYAAWLRTIGEPALHYSWFLWIQRIVLLVAVVLHIAAAVQLSLRDRRARPIGYAHGQRPQATFATRTMRYGGVILALFIVWHLLDLTAGAVNPKGANATPYDKVVADFAPSHWYVTLFYVVAVIAVGLHLRHGIRSAFQTLGHTGHDRLAAVVSALLVVGFLAVPAAVTIGWVR